MDDDDDFGADPEFLSALASSATSSTKLSQPNSQPASRPQQPTPQRIQQPIPQRLDKRPPSNTTINTATTATATAGPKIVQPTPQALPQRSSGSSILVSPRQKGNPVLASLRSLPWEYSDIPADYGLGLTTCALFLSLKYHRLHPEYIYTRIRNLQGKYNLRILLTMVDIPNHEDALRELSKTSLINNVTIILCWSAAEAARYLELYKSYEHANFGAIKGQQATSYAEKLVEFVTVPRGINKADAISLVSAFGSLKNAINGDPEQVSMIAGWGEKKVKRWCSVVEEPFRVQHAAKRRLVSSESSAALDQAIPISLVPPRDNTSNLSASASAGSTPNNSAPSRPRMGGKLPNETNRDHSRDLSINDEEEAMLAAAIEESKKTAAQESGTSTRKECQLSGGIAAELAKLREKG
ncbi:restriction endonuclease type II-like protein [Biscogniauxia mediterranea]|nr:restriction endonuclease type II-like protein [Biscogniauxia mediterranea]